jgi:hypothetical protein
MRYHVTYMLPGYEALQVERFASQEEADRRYDELTQNRDVHKLSQPIDTEAQPSTWPTPQVSISVSVNAGEQPEDEAP